MIEVKKHFYYLHQIPEPSFKEFKTHAYILRVLSKLKCDLHELTPTGIIAYFNFNRTKTIAIRAEMDALPIEEKTGLEYQSKNGFMHACGHDAHMSMVLGVCEYLNSNKPNVNVVVIFQPSEEVYGGALKVVGDEYFQKLAIDAIYGIHLFPNLEYNKFFTSEYLMASATEIDVTIKGKKTHITEKGIDAIKVANEFLSKIKVKPNEIFNCGAFIALGQRNIICDNTLLECTYRTFSSSDNFIKELTKIKNELASKSNAKIDIKTRVIPVLKNDLTLIKNKNFCTLKNGFFQAEDFAFYAKKYRALFLLLGCGKTPCLHSDEFAFDLELLDSGYNCYLDIINGSN